MENLVNYEKNSGGFGFATFWMTWVLLIICVNLVKWYWLYYTPHRFWSCEVDMCPYSCVFLSSQVLRSWSSSDRALQGLHGLWSYLNVSVLLMILIIICVFQRSEMFCDTTKMPIIKKRVQSMSEQDPFESRRFVYMSGIRIYEQLCFTENFTRFFTQSLKHTTLSNYAGLTIRS